MATKTAESQKDKKGAPHATTQDQISEMESEGQAQTHAPAERDVKAGKLSKDPPGNRVKIRRGAE